MESNVIDYVLEKYPKTFKNKEILVEENYEEEGQTTHVFYLPLIDIALEVYK
jgi:hypothetical protein